MGCVFSILESQSAIADTIINFLYDPIPKGLTNREKHKKINEILEREGGIATASEVLINISKDEIERARLLSELKYELDTQSNLVHARRTGHQEGLQEGIQIVEKKGRKEGKKESNQDIINLLKSGKTPDEIIREYDT